MKPRWDGKGSKRDYWRQIVAALPRMPRAFDEITIENQEMLEKYRGEYPDARIGTTLRIPRPQKFEPLR